MNPLRIGIDARELLGQTTGVGRYLGELLLQKGAGPAKRNVEKQNSHRKMFLFSSGNSLLATEILAWIL